MKKIKIRRYIELSTNHITPSTNEKLMNEETDYKGIYARSYDNGFYVYIEKNKKEGEKLPEDLKNIKKYAKKAKADLVILDCRCQEVEELKSYNK